MDVYTKWCGPCRLLDKKTFGNPDVSGYISQNFYAVKFNAEGDEEIFFMIKVFQIQITIQTEKVEIQLMISPSF